MSSSTKVKRSSSFSEGDRKGRRRGGAVKTTTTTTTTTMSNQSRRRSKKVRSQTDVSRRRQSATVAVPDAQLERRRRHKSYDADDEEATAGRLRVTFTRESRRYSDSESDRYESCDDDDEYVSESDYGQSSSDDDDAIDNDWSPWITLAKRTNNALAAGGGVVTVTPTTNSAQSNAAIETKKTEVKRSKKGGFFRRLFGGDKKEKDVGNKKGGGDGTIGGRRPQRFPSPPKRKAPEIDPESRRKAIEVHVSGTRHEVVCREEEEEEESQQDQEREISKLDGDKRVAVVMEASRDDLDEILDSMSTSTIVSKTSSRMMSSKSQSPSPSNERSGRPVIVRVHNSKKSTSSAGGGGGEVSPLAPAPRIPGPDPALVTSFKYVPGGSCPMTSTYVSDRSHVGKKLDFTISAAARNAGISPALLKKLCADSKEIDVQRSPSPQSRGRGGDSSGTGSVETIIANPKYLKRTRSDLTSLDGFSDIPIYECRHEALVEENGVESRRRYGQRDAGSSERDETRDGDREDPDVDDNDERRRSLMLRQRNLKSLVVGDDKPTTRGAGPPATMSAKIVIEDFDNDEGKAVQTSTWIKSQATIARRHRVARSSPPPYDDGKTIVSTTDSGYCSGDVKSPPSGRGGKASTDVIVPNSYRARTSSILI